MAEGAGSWETWSRMCSTLRAPLSRQPCALVVSPISGLSLFSLCLAHSSEVLKALSLAGGFPGGCHAPSGIPPIPGLCPTQTGPPGFWAVTV